VVFPISGRRLSLLQRHLFRLDDWFQQMMQVAEHFPVRMSTLATMPAK